MISLAFVRFCLLSSQRGTKLIRQARPGHRTLDRFGSSALANISIIYFSNYFYILPYCTQ